MVRMWSILLLLFKQGCVDVRTGGEPERPRHDPEGPEIQRLREGI
jgi:hypothetical protein